MPKSYKGSRVAYDAIGYYSYLNNGIPPDRLKSLVGGTKIWVLSVMDLESRIGMRVTDSIKMTHSYIHHISI